MKSGMWRRGAIKAALLAALMHGQAGIAHADCTRDIQVPVALIGMSITQQDNGAVGGIYPEALQSPVTRAGCKFVYSIVPRARLEVLFEMGKADVLLPASRTPARDKHGVFIPMINHRATLLSLSGHPRPPIVSAQELLDHKELRVAVVRGYDFGEQYQWLVRELAQQGRLYQEVDTVAVARLMQAGAVDVTIMGPTLFLGAVQRDARVAGLAERLRVEPIPELPWNWSGAYISRQSLTMEDQATLRDLLERIAKSPAILESFQRIYKPEFLLENVRQR